MCFAQSAALQLRGCACCTALLLCCAELRFGVWIPGAGALLCCARGAWWIPPRRVAGFCAHCRSARSARGRTTSIDWKKENLLMLKAVTVRPDEKCLKVTEEAIIEVLEKEPKWKLPKNAKARS